MYDDFVKAMERVHPELLRRAKEEMREMEKRRNASRVWENTVTHADNASFSLLSFFGS